MDFIEVDINRVIMALSIVFLLYYLVSGLLLYISAFIPYREDVSYKKYLWLVALLMILILGLIILKKTTSWLMMGIIVLSFIVVAFISIRYKKGLIIVNKKNDSVATKIMRHKYADFVLLALLVALCAWGMGYIVGMNKIEFLTTKIDGKEVLLVRSYNSKSIFIGFDKQSNKLRNEIIILSGSETSRLTFHYEKNNLLNRHPSSLY